MRYFLDTEFNGFGGCLISLGLAAEEGDQDYYVVVPMTEEPRPWVAEHVIPYLSSVPKMLYNQLDAIAAAHDIAAYLRTDPEPEIVADWPEDIALFCRFHFMRTPGFSTARNSKVPHNALHDARALRDFVLSTEG
jgi:hypothetical protein